jgi:hypothetical protein
MSANRYVCYSGVKVFEVETVGDEDDIRAFYGDVVVIKTRTKIADLVRFNIIPTPEGYRFDYDKSEFTPLSEPELVEAGLLTEEDYNTRQEQRRRQAYASTVDPLVCEYHRLSICGMFSKRNELTAQIQQLSLTIHNDYLYWQEQAWTELPVEEEVGDLVENSDTGVEEGAGE